MSNVDVNKIVGNSFEDLDVSEMSKVQGSGDKEVRTTPVCASFAVITFTAGIVVSKKIC